jgi:hypothetical protein
MGRRTESAPPSSSDDDVIPPASVIAACAGDFADDAIVSNVDGVADGDVDSALELVLFPIREPAGDPVPSDDRSAAVTFSLYSLGGASFDRRASTSEGIRTRDA